MPDALQDTLDLNRVGPTPVTLTGRLELQQLSRLRALARPGGHADVQLRAVEEQGRRWLRGEIRAEVPLICQRCLDTLQYPVAADVRLMWVRAGSESVHLPEGYDAIVSASGRIKLANLVEDELLLALPMVARHEPPDECAARFSANGVQSSVEAEIRTPGPFAVLEALKRH